MVITREVIREVRLPVMPPNLMQPSLMQPGISFMSSAPTAQPPPSNPPLVAPSSSGPSNQENERLREENQSLREELFQAQQSHNSFVNQTRQAMHTQRADFEQAAQWFEATARQTLDSEASAAERDANTRVLAHRECRVNGFITAWRRSPIGPSRSSWAAQRTPGCPM